MRHIEGSYLFCTMCRHRGGVGLCGGKCRTVTGVCFNVYQECVYYDSYFISLSNYCQLLFQKFFEKEIN